MNTWIGDVFQNQQEIDEYGIVKGIVKQTLSNKFHEKMPKGAALREIAQDPYHQINWETPYYEQEIGRFLSNTDNSKPVLDVGCGDGRFTKTLLAKGFQKIVCLDSDYRLLRSIHQYASEAGFRDKVLLVCADADELSFKSQVFSAVLAIGVLYYLNEEQPYTLSKIRDILVGNGTLILSEPDKEGMIYRALLFENLQDTLEVFEQGVFKEGRDNTDFKFKLKTTQQQQSWIEQAGFEVVDKHGITMFHNFLRVMLVRGIIKQDEIEAKRDTLLQLFDFLHTQGTLFKHIIWKCTKK